MTSPTPLPPSARSPSTVSPKGKWRPWSVPINPSSLSRTLCGHLNKLTSRNFIFIADRIGQLAWSVELSENRDALDTFVRAVFHRGITDERQQALYALLCQRIIIVLEAERSRWRKVDILHISNPFQSFETVMTRLALDEYSRIRSSHIPEELGRLMRFLGELVVYGVLVSADVGDMFVSLLEGVKRNDEHLAVVTCRFLSPMTRAFNAPHILGDLQASHRLEQVLKEDGLAPMVRYLMMGMLHRVSYPTPHNPFGSPWQRVETQYSMALDEYYIDDDDGVDDPSDEDDAENNEWMQRDCEDWTKAFLLYHDYHHLGDILHSLRPVHRKQLLRCLVSAALYSDEVVEARCVGSIYDVPRIHELCSSGQLFEEMLREELMTLQDVLLDVPNAVKLMANILHSTTLDATKLNALIDSSVTSQTVLAGMLRDEMNRLEREERAGRPAEEDKLTTHDP